MAFMSEQFSPERPRIIGKSPVIPRSWPVSLAVALVSSAALFYIYKRRIVADVLETVFLAVFLFFGINAVSARIRIESVSMQSTLYAGDFVFVNKLAYQIGKPERGDVIVFRYPPDPTQIPYIKRVIGLPGDQIKIENGSVFINGYPLTEPYLDATTSRGGSWTVPAESLFVMGDNRNNSSDSRAWGYVPYENIIGKAEAIYLPVERWGWLHQSLAVAAEPIQPPPTSAPLPSATPAATYPEPFFSDAAPTNPDAVMQAYPVP